MSKVIHSTSIMKVNHKSIKMNGNEFYKKEDASYGVWYDAFKIEAPTLFRRLKKKHEALKPLFDENKTVLDAIKELRVVYPYKNK